MAGNPQGLNAKSRAILKYIARGHSYQQILDTYPDFTYVDIFNAAQEALDIIDYEINRGEDKKQTDHLAKIRELHPRAYEKWGDEEDTHLVELFQSGIEMKQIATTL